MMDNYYFMHFLRCKENEKKKLLIFNHLYLLFYSQPLIRVPLFHEIIFSATFFKWADTPFSASLPFRSKIVGTA